MPASSTRLQPLGPPARDGRAERAERTRQAVADAMLALLEEGDLRPTAQRIAERAGVSLRTVFHHYQDMESLLALVADTQIERVVKLARPVPRDGSLDRRIESLAAERASLYETIAPVRRSALLSEPFSPEIASRLQWTRERNRAEISKVFAAELRALPPASRRDLLEALTAAASWSAWEALRAHQALTPAQAKRVMTRTMRALLKEVTS